MPAIVGIAPAKLAQAYRTANTLPTSAERRYANAYVSWMHGHGIGHPPLHPRVSRRRAAELRDTFARMGLWENPPMTRRKQNAPQPAGVRQNAPRRRAPWMPTPDQVAETKAAERAARKATRYGVFVWRSDAKYHPISAVRSFVRESDAKRFADANIDLNYVVRPFTVTPPTDAQRASPSLGYLRKMNPKRRNPTYSKASGMSALAREPHVVELDANDIRQATGRKVSDLTTVGLAFRPDGTFATLSHYHKPSGELAFPKWPLRDRTRLIQYASAFVQHKLFGTPLGAAVIGQRRR